MRELLAEVGRNPIIAEINRNVDARLRASLEAALVSLAPVTSGQCRATITDFIISLSWGMVAGMELYPFREHGTLRCYVGSLLQREVSALANRSEERRLGKEGVSKCRSRWSPNQ